MIEVVTEYVVREQARGQFELAYGPGGAWSQLFAGAPGFRGATLLRDTHDARRYLAIDVWDAEALREQALADGAAEYARLQADLDAWAASRRELGVYRVQAEAAVRPRGRARPRGRGAGTR
jgi:heme-degrading monooxygenase HmoA